MYTYSVSVLESGRYQKLDKIPAFLFSINQQIISLFDDSVPVT